MKLKDVKHIAVIGSGTMGHGIAELAALAGYQVTMQDISEEIVNKGYENIKWSLQKLAEKNLVPKDKAERAAKSITPLVDLKEAVKNADVVIEAAPEIMKLKKELFDKLEQFAPKGAVLASNTSSLSITEIGKMTKRPDQVVGMHFFNPPVKMALVEVIKGKDTSEETMQLIVELSEKLGKTPVRVSKDVRGFIVNRVLVGPFLFEAGWMVSRGEATVEQVDSRMKFYEGFPMGPFELQDLTGIDIGYHLTKEAGLPVPTLIEEKVKKGEIGRKSGKGFYDYKGAGAQYAQDAGKDFDPLPIYALMVNEAAWLLENKVTTAEEIDLAVRLGAGFPEGILRRADKLGLDKLLAALEKRYQQHKDERYKPVALLTQMVQAGKTGQAAGQGFYHYGTQEGAQTRYHAIKVDIDQERRVAWITLNRPDRLNAINSDMRSELPRAFAELNQDERVRAIVIQGAGDKAFSAGADITEFSSAAPTQMVGLGSEFFSAPAQSPKPVIAAIDGFCLGGGMELALACDFRLASKRSQLGQPEIHLGLIPGGGGTQRLARLVGASRAKELCMFGERINAEQAREWGLVNRVYDDGSFKAKAKEFAETLAARAPVAVCMTKRVIDEGAQAPMSTGLLLEREAFGLLFTTEDMSEGVTAFLTKRKPDFKGK